MLRYLLLALLCISVACGGDGKEGAAASRGAPFAACETDLDCQIGLLCATDGRIRGHCSASCEKDTECKARFGASHACGDTVCVQICGWHKVCSQKPTTSLFESCSGDLECRGEHSDSCASQCTRSSWGFEERQEGFWGPAEVPVTEIGSEPPILNPKPPLSCGGKTCTSVSGISGVIDAGCARDMKDAEVCGLSSAGLGLDDSVPAFLPQNALGVASASCGNYFDALEPADAGTKGNGRIDRMFTSMSLPLTASYAGCCTPAGQCSGDTTKVMTKLGSAVIENTVGLGCVEPQYFFTHLPENQRIVRCNPGSGSLIDAGSASDAGASDAGANDAGKDGGKDGGI